MVNPDFGLHQRFSFHHSSFVKPTFFGVVILLFLLGTVPKFLPSRHITISAADRDNGNYFLAETIKKNFWIPDEEKTISLEKEQQPIYTTVIYLNGSRYTFMTENPDIDSIASHLGIEELDEYKIHRQLSPILNTSTIRLSHIQYVTGIYLQKIPFETQIRKNKNISSGKIKTIQNGVLGITEVVQMRTFENDKLISSKKISEQVITPPVNKIIEIGTKPLPLPKQFSEPITKKIDNKSVTYCQEIKNVYATSYDRHCLGCSGRGITSTGKKLQKGIIAANTSFLPYGTKLYVPGYGYGEIQDTGGGLTNRQIDLGWWDFEQDNANWSSRTLNIYILCE